MRNRPTPSRPPRLGGPGAYTPRSVPVVTSVHPVPPAMARSAAGPGAAAPVRGARARRANPTRAPHDGWTFVLIPPGTGAKPWTMRVSVRRLRVIFGSLIALATGTLSVGVLLAVLLSMAPRVEEEMAGVRLGVFEEDSAPVVQAATPLQLMAPALEVASALSVASGTRAAPAAKAPAPARSSRTAARPDRRPAARGVSPVNSLADVDAGLLASLPVIGRITSQWSNARRHPVLGVVRRHQGVDIAAPTGTRITAPAAGRVIFAGTKVGFGRTVEIDHGNGVITRYAHCRLLKVKPGERVTDGQLIATVGATGLAKGPHLHYEVLVNGRSVDPLRTPLNTLLQKAPVGGDPTASTSGAPAAGSAEMAPAATQDSPLDVEQQRETTGEVLRGGR